MLLTTKARYAVMAMVDMSLSTSDCPIALSVIAKRQNITLKYLEQIFQFLKRADLVESIKGPGGGYKLSQPPHRINILSIIEAVKEDIKFTRCNKEHGCMHDKTVCITHHLWEAMESQLNNFLAKSTLADVCERRYRYAV